MRFLLLLSLVLLTACNQETKNKKMSSSDLTTYYFIRHAEKDTTNTGKDPELTVAGQARARKWAEVFKDIEFDLIYSSDYKRTLNTAKPIAESQQKEIAIFNTKKINDREFQKTTKGKKVLVVGHSNLNPEWVNYILEEEKYEDLSEAEYGSLFIAVIHPDGSRTSEVLYFN